jgi:hypothetical protein
MKELILTEAELVEASATYNGLLMGWISAFFAGFTAYLIVAYLVGKKLTRSQVIFINVCYCFYTGLCIIAVFGAGSLLTHFAHEVEGVNPDRPFIANYSAVYAATGILVLGVVGSLKFMWDARHPKTE